MLKFTKDHEWVLWEDSEEAIVGISEHAVEELGDITYVELPEVGASVSKGEATGFVESVKAASDIYAPISGEISEVNDTLESEPETLNKDPMGKGWI
ncbi:MAG: glycine cleavage system protein GcvH, partial [Epsilonproteobacteria bacterium]|nr:glycine cleavage system protein GcvH [Campylobacterota bacterium]